MIVRDPHLAHRVSWPGKRVSVQAHAIGHLPGRQHPPSAIPPQDLCRAYGICLTRLPVNNPNPHAVRTWCGVIHTAVSFASFYSPHLVESVSSTRTIYSASPPDGCPDRSAGSSIRHRPSGPGYHTPASWPPGRRNTTFDTVDGRVETPPSAQQRSAGRHSRSAQVLHASGRTELRERRFGCRCCTTPPSRCLPRIGLS